MSEREAERSPTGRVAVIGAGRVGTAMASILCTRGFEVSAVFDTDAAAAERAAELSGAVAATSAPEAARTADIVLITTPDDSIEEASGAVAVALGDTSGKRFVHMSGALGLGVLGEASARGADVLSIHPIQTFADLEGAVRSIPGSTFGVTCAPDLEEWARGFVDAMEGNVLVVADSQKALYHAAAVMACNLFTMLEHAALSVYTGLGLSDEDARAALLPLVRTTLYNIERMGPAPALTGPLARGDVATLLSNIEALEVGEPELASVYRVLSLWGLRLVEQRGELSDKVIEEMRRLLQGSGSAPEG